MNEDLKRLRQQRAAMLDRLVMLQHSVIETQEQIKRSTQAIGETQDGLARLEREIVRLQELENSD